MCAPFSIRRVSDGSRCADIRLGGVIMKCNRWRFAFLSLLSFVFLAAGVAFASEEVTPADQPQATAEVSTEVDAAVQPEAVDESATEPEVATVIDEGLIVRPQLLLPAAPRQACRRWSMSVETSCARGAKPCSMPSAPATPTCRPGWRPTTGPWTPTRRPCGSSIGVSATTRGCITTPGWTPCRLGPSRNGIGRGCAAT